MRVKASLSFIAVLAMTATVVAACSASTGSNDATAKTTAAASAAAALDTAGVSNAERWAHEVVEYRLYPADDPNLAKLRNNLAKYSPGDETVDKIVSALAP